MVGVAALGVLLALGGVSGLSKRQSETPSSTDFIRRSWHRVTILDNSLFLYGGEINQLIDGEPDARNKSRQANSTLYIDLSSSWSRDTVELKKADETNTLFHKGPTLWKDPFSSSFFTIGGDQGLNGAVTSDKVSQLRQFTWDGKEGRGSWSTPEPSNPGVFGELVPTAASSSTTCAGLGIYTGAYSNSFVTSEFNSSQIVPVPGLITYDSSSRTWANVSMDPFSHSFAYGELVCLDAYGNDGLVMFLGGATMDGVAAPKPGGEDLTQFSSNNITLYDPKSGSWYWQIATGDLPPGRMFFCAVAAKSDNSTEIFMYGGQPGDGSTLGDLYILTIPGFRWFKGPDGTERQGNRCVTAGGKQMISVGGLTRPFNSRVGWGIKDPWSQGIGILDMTSLEWKSDYDANADNYTSPDVVQEWYKNGGLESVFWSNSAAKDVFSSARSVEPPPNGEPPSEDEDKGKSTPVGAIAGGVVGGVVAVALIVLGVWMLRRRRKQPAPELAGASAESYAHPSHASHDPTPQYKPELDSLHVHELSPNNTPSPRHELPSRMDASQMNELPADEPRRPSHEISRL